MKKIQAWVKFKVEVEFCVKDDATEDEINGTAIDEAAKELEYNAEIDDIEWYEN
jgi:hypothetical protein